ncbi:YciI family protein [Streptomyces sp. NPDC002526]
MKFMMFVCTDSEPETGVSDDCGPWVAANDANGRRVLGSPLVSAKEALTVRVRNGELLVTEGPFAATQDVIVGFDILECADSDEAIEVARAHPLAQLGRLELRPFASLEELIARGDSSQS